MIVRRDLLKLGLVLPAAFSPARLLAATPGIEALVIDRRALSVAPNAPAIGDTVHLIDGDVTTFWLDTLDAAWRRPGFVLAGLTDANALFVLEHLAWDRGRRVTYRRRIEGADIAGRPLLRWIIAPVHPAMKA